MISCFPTLPAGHLFYRPLEHTKVVALKANSGGYEGKVKLRDFDLKCLNWWIFNIPQAIAPIRRSNHDCEMWTDASGYAYGSFFQQQICQGFFSAKERALSINTKETLAVWYSLLSFRDSLKGWHVKIYSDNVTCISYVSSMGGMKSELRDKICWDIWSFVFENNMWLSISFIAGRDNQNADFASRCLNENTEFEISQDLFNEVCMELQFIPEIDGFASRLNNKCKKYFSYTPDPFSIGVNSFLTSWSGHKLYLFPPLNCYSQVVTKLETDRGKALIAYPDWPGQPWYPHLHCLLVKREDGTDLRTLRGLPMPVSLPWSPGELLVNFRKHQLVFAIISG